MKNKNIKSNIRCKRPKSSIKKQKAFKEDVQKVVDRAKKIILPNTEKKIENTNSCEDLPKQSKRQSEASMTFFYTSDKYFTQFDDIELIQAIQQKYPAFMDDSTEDSDMKKIIIQLIQDKKFVMDILDTFNMNIQEFFKFIFRSNLAIFKGPYLNKLQRILIDNKYDI